PQAAPAAPGVPATPIDAKYAESGGPTGKLGPPTGEELPLPKRVGRFRMYANGVIVWTPQLGAQAVNFTELLTLLAENGIAPK
ncbi:MAG: stage II sporulation protein, partial [Mycobacteriaceae bacterium]|nr:stage II sporulation protein [Mycobacteriaceae bacterium]